MNHTIKQKGQIMMLIVVIMGGLALSASGIAGLLMFFEVQRSNDAASSAMAGFAADAGVEKALSCYYHTPGDTLFPLGYNAAMDVCVDSGSLHNGATYDTRLWCVDWSMNRVSCLDNASVAGFKVRSIGVSQRAERILETFYATQFNH